jgi:hypothetical protein
MQKSDELTFGIEKPGDSILSLNNVECLVQSLANGAVANVSPVDKVGSAKIHRKIIRNEAIFNCFKISNESVI